MKNLHETLAKTSIILVAVCCALVAGQVWAESPDRYGFEQELIGNPESGLPVGDSGNRRDPRYPSSGWSPPAIQFATDMIRKLSDSVGNTSNTTAPPSVGNTTTTTAPPSVGNTTTTTAPPPVGVLTIGIGGEHVYLDEYTELQQSERRLQGEIQRLADLMNRAKAYGQRMRGVNRANFTRARNAYRKAKADWSTRQDDLRKVLQRQQRIRDLPKRRVTMTGDQADDRWVERAMRDAFRNPESEYYVNPGR